MRECRLARRWVERSLDGTLALEDRFRLEEHLAECAPCRARHARHAALEEAFERLPEPAFERLDVEAAVRAIGAAIEETPSDGERVGAARPRPRRAAAVAAGALAVAAAAAILAVLWGGERDTAPTQPGPSAMSDGEGGGAAQQIEPDGVQPGDDLALADGDTPQQTTEPQQVPEPGAAPLDEARLERARTEVALTLLDELGSLGPDASREAVAEAVARFDERAHPLRSARWPVDTIAAGLVERGEPRVARAAARLLGVRGGPVEMHALRAALSRREVKREAVRALGDAGERGLAGLAAALNDPEIAAEARDALARVGGVAAATVLAEAAARGGDGADDALAALAALGPAGVAPLARLAGRGDLDDARLAALLGAAPGGRAELDRLAREGPEALSDAAWFAAARALQPAGLLPWLVEHCADRVQRAAALDALSHYGGELGAAALLAASRSSGMRAEELAPAAARMVATAGPAFASLADALVRDGRLDDAVALLELVALSAQPEGVPALLALASRAELDELDRQWAVLAARELAMPEQAALFGSGFSACGERERRLAAAYLIAFTDLAGVEAALDLVGPRSSREAGRLRRLVERAAQRGASVALLQLAREIEPYLPSDDPDPRSSRSRRNTP